MALDTEQAPSRPIALQRPDAGTHLPVLDGVRGVAIILVLLLHFTLYGELTPTLPVEWVYYKIMTAGWIGVDLFFVLSGFLITGILYDSKGGEHYFRNFYIRRVLRIFPLYYGSLVVFFLVLPIVFPSDPGLRALRQHATWYWTYLSNVLVARDGWSSFGPIEHFWSLAVEEQFYLVWPLAVFLLGRRALMAACLACIVGSLLIRVGLELRGHEIAAHVLTPARMDALAVGALLALVARRPNGLHDLARWARPALALAAAALVAVFAWRRGLPSEDVVVSTIGYSLLAVLFGAFLVLGLGARPETALSRVLTAPALMLFGRYSYAMYVFHHPVVTMLKRRTTWLDTVPPLLGSRLLAQILFTVVGITIVMGMASLSWHLYEKQFLKLKRLFPYTRTAPNTALGTPRAGVDQPEVRSPA